MHERQPTLALASALTLFVLPLLYRALARWQARHVDEAEAAALAPGIEPAME